MTTESLTPGARLRQARLAKNLELEQVAETLRLSKPQLEAIENDDFTYMPRLAYVRGHLRMYAKFLELPPLEILQTFDSLGIQDGESLTALQAPPIIELGSKKLFPNFSRHMPSHSLIMWSAGILIILAGLIYISFRHSPHIAPKAKPVVTQQQPLQTETVINNPNDNGQPMPLTIPPQPAPGEPILNKASGQ